MFRNSVLTFAAALMAVVALAGVAAELNAAVLVSVYSEDFEGGANPQSITAAPFSYTAAGGPAGSIQVKSGSFLPTDAVDGSTLTGLSVAAKAIAEPTAARTYTLTADLYAASGGNDSGIGLARTGSGGYPYNNSGAYLLVNSAGWNLDARGVAGAADVFTFPLPAGVGFDEKVEGTVHLDLVAGTVTGTIAPASGGTWSHTFSLPADLTAAMAINRFTIQQRVTGLDVDNVAITGVLPPPPSGVVVYSEDFEGGADPQSILAPPFSYSAGYGPAGDIQVKSGSFLPTDAVDGSTLTGLSAAAQAIAGPDPDTLTYSVTADLYAASGANDSAIGLSRTSHGNYPFNNSGAYLRADGDSWELDAQGVVGSGAVFDFPAGVGLNEAVVGTIMFDLVDKMVTGSIAHSGGTMSHSFVLPADLTNVMSIDRFVIQQRVTGLDVDNVLILRLVPEPASGVLALLGLVGLLVCGRRRRPDH